jgi:hypothetical protein
VKREQAPQASDGSSRITHLAHHVSRKLIELDLAAGNYRQSTVFANGAKHFA